MLKLNLRKYEPSHISSIYQKWFWTYCGVIGFIGSVSIIDVDVSVGEVSGSDVSIGDFSIGDVSCGDVSVGNVSGGDISGDATGKQCINKRQQWNN